jgi:hypothetical protein
LSAPTRCGTAGCPHELVWAAGSVVGACLRLVQPGTVLAGHEVRYGCGGAAAEGFRSTGGVYA